METKNSHGLFKDLFKHIKEEKEARMAFLYSVSYFIFIVVLLIFGFRSPAQTPVHFNREVKIIKLNSPPGEVQNVPQEKTNSGIGVVFVK